MSARAGIFRNPGRALRVPLGTALGALLFLATAAPALAGVGFGVTPTFPTTVTVGQTGLPASVQILNASTPPESAGNVTLGAINMVPACGTTAFVAAGDCPAAQADPGVFAISATGSGETGTACVGQTFAIAVVDAATGQVSFTPSGGPVVLTPPATANSVCRIDFSFSVLKAPTKPASASAAGTVNTAQIGFATGTAAVNGATGTGSGSSFTTVALAQPAIVTAATATSTVGAPITDTATLSGGVGPTGTITFKVFGPADATCAATAVATSTVPVGAGNGNYTSLPFSPTVAGTYRWTAAYSGDANNLPALGACNAAGETTTTNLPAPMIGVTKAASPASRPAPGGDFTFTMTVSNPSTTTPVTITKLVDNVYGDLATRAGSTCNALIGITLAPGQTSSPCSFTGPFSGASGASQTDTVTVTGVNGNTTVTATAMATVTLTPPPPGPAIALKKTASPASLAAPGGTFTFTATVSNPSSATPVTITKLVDNIYGDLATRPGSTCGTLIGVTLAPGATSTPCTFTGAFTGSSGATQTDTITVTGTGGGATVTATAQATVTLTAGPPAKAVVSPVTLHGPAACVTRPFKIYVSGGSIKSVSYSLDGQRIGTVTKKDSSGHFSITVKPGALSKGKVHHLTAVVAPVAHSGQPVRTVRRSFAVCAAPTVPRFTG